MKYLAYALTILTLSAVLLACGDTAPATTDGTTTAVTTAVITPANTVDRDTLYNPSLPQDERDFVNAVWAAVKDSLGGTCTINEIVVNRHFYRVDDVFMGFYEGASGPDGERVTDGPPAVLVETVGGYEFIFGNYRAMEIFTDGKRYSLQNAYSSGAITEDQLRRLWEMHKEGNIYYEEQ